MTQPRKHASIASAAVVALLGLWALQPAQPVHLKPTDTVHITRTGHRYHLAGCSSLSKSDIPLPLKVAVARGYTPCRLCVLR